MAKPRPITSPDRPGLPDFSRATLKNMGRPGYEASPGRHFASSYFTRARDLAKDMALGNSGGQTVHVISI